LSFDGYNNQKVVVKDKCLFFNHKSFASDTAINLITINTDYSFMVSE